MITHCKKEYQREWRKNNPEKSKTYCRKWRDKNRNKTKELNRKYRETHRREIREKAKKYAQKRQNIPEVRYNDYKKQKKRIWDLTFEQFMTFWQKPCYYCGDKMENIGLDRIDNTKGYKLENIVSCCKICNFLKRDFTQEVFVNQCLKISKMSISQGLAQQKDELLKRIGIEMAQKYEDGIPITLAEITKIINEQRIMRKIKTELKAQEMMEHKNCDGEIEESIWSTSPSIYQKDCKKCGFNVQYLKKKEGNMEIYIILEKTRIKSKNH